MVLEELAKLCIRYGCDPEDVCMAASFDELNILPRERAEIAVTLEDVYGVPIPDEVLDTLDTVEDLVGYIEDRL